MKKLTCLFALGFLLFNNTLRANEPEKVTSTEEVSETAAKKERIKQVTKDDDYEKFRFGGYGEMVAKFMNYGTNRFYGGRAPRGRYGRKGRSKASSCRCPCHRKPQWNGATPQPK